MKNKKLEKLEILTIILVTINIFLYEIGFCNFKSIINGEYNFSLFRIIMYIAFITVYIIYFKKTKEEANKILPKKKKIIYSYLIISTIFIIFKILTGIQTYTLILLLLIVLNGLLFILYITKDYIKNIVITILTLGFTCCIATEVYHIIDEKKHFVSTLNVAVGNFDFNKPLNDEEFDNIKFYTSPMDFARKYFSIKCTLNMENIPEDENIFSTPAEYSPILYLPGSIGINIARLLGGSIADAYIAGRIFNMITYGILLVILFKILPFKKNVFYVTYLLPYSLVLAGSYSIDGITVGIIGIFIAYTYKLYKENYENINFKQAIILLLIFLGTILCKGGGYIAIAFMVFILPVFKILKENKKIRITVIIAILITLTVGFLQTNKITTQEGDVRGGDTSPARQIQFLMEDPTNILKVYYNFLRDSILNLDWYNNFNSGLLFKKDFVITTYLLFVFVLYTAITDVSYTFNKKEKRVTTITFFLIYFITTFILYLSFTAVGNLNIAGYQARYLTPVLPLLLCNINPKTLKAKENENDEEGYSNIAIINGLIITVDIISMII